MLQLFSFELDEETFKDEPVYYIEMPKSWWEFIDSKRESKKFNIRPLSIERKIKTIFPEIFEVNWSKNPWMLSDEKVDTSTIRLLYLRWFAEEEKCRVTELETKLQEANLVINKATMGELLKKYNNKGWVYSWIPALMARRFAKNPKQVFIPSVKDESLNKELAFYHVNFNNKHECMSEPIRKNEHHEYFSYVIRFLYKNRGLNPEDGIVNVYIGIRRFLQQPIHNFKSQIEPNKNGSILIGLKDGFIKRTKIASLSQWSFRRYSNSLDWQKNIGENIFSDVLMNERLNPARILKNPASYLTEREDVKAFVVYNEQIFKVKGLSTVKSGVGIPEKNILFRLVKKEFPNLKPLEYAQKVSTPHSLNTGGNKNYFPFLHQFEEGTTITLEVWSKHKNGLVKEIIPVLAEEKIILGENDNGTYRLNANPKVNIRFINQDSLGIVEALNIEKYGSKAEKYHIRTIEKKLVELKDNQNLKVSLIEILEKEKWSGRSDPKQAIRKGFAKCGRLTQFIYPIIKKESDKKYRIRSSILDLLTDLGFVRGTTSKVTRKEEIVGFGLIRHYRSVFPVVYHLKLVHLKVKLYNSSTWFNFNEALLEVAKLSENELLDTKYDENKKKLQSYFKRGLREVLAKSENDVLLLADARLRDFWPEFRNGDIKLANLPFDISVPNVENRVRVVRVNQTDDVPQYRTINSKDKDKPNRESGLFYDESGIFYSAGRRPDTMGSTSNDELKFESPEEAFFHQRLLELIVLGTENLDERKRLATIVNQLRRINIAYNFYTVLPYPLHLNGALRKYMNFIKDSQYNYNEFDDRIEVLENNQLAFVIK